MSELLPLILKDVTRIMRYVPHALACGGTLLAARLLVVKKSRRKGLLNEVLILVFISFLVLVLFYTLYNRKVMNDPVLDLKWYGTWLEGPQGRAYVIENVLLFIPVGFFGGCLLRRNEQWRVLLFGFLFSLAIEVLQFTWRLRLAELSDLIMNIVGTAVGCLFACFIP